ncbi:MAG: TldD/PmbA family protein, partial [Nitrospinota bacterium]
YVNALLEPRRALMTGMTRDGTFYLEGGRERWALRNLRFTQSVVEALGQVEAVGKSQERHAFWAGGGCLVPALKLPRFRLTHGGF